MISSDGIRERIKQCRKLPSYNGRDREWEEPPVHEVREVILTHDDLAIFYYILLRIPVNSLQEGDLYYN